MFITLARELGENGMIEQLIIDTISHVQNMSMFDISGWVGAICLACCAVPQAILSVRQGHSDGISKGLLWLWSLGEIFTLIYLLAQPYDNWNWPLVVNYSANIVFIGIVVWYKIFPKNKV